MRPKTTSSPRRRRSRKNAIPGLEDRVGDAVIDRELGAAAAAEEPPAAAPEPSPAPPPPPNPDGGVRDLGTKSTEETAALVRELYRAAVTGAAGPRDPAKLGELPDVKATLYAKAAEKVIGDEEILTPRRALYVLLFAVVDTFLAARAARSYAAAAAAPPPKEKTA